MMHLRSLILSSVFALSFAACGDDPMVGDRDSGGGGGDAGPTPDAGPGEDTGPDDTTPPVVTATTPGDGSSDVGVDTVIAIRFSEAMDTTVGTVSVSSGGAPIEVTTSWDAAASELTVEPVDPLPSSATIDVTVGEDFADLAGNTLVDPVSFSFTTRDVTAPTIVSSIPADGSSIAPRSLTEISVEMSEPMDVSLGTLELTGGPGTLGTPRWEGTTLRVPVEGLAYDTIYQIVLTGYADRAGNALAGDTTIDFTTEPDTDAPVVVDANPAEGQLDVPATTRTVTVTFDEAMDTSITTASLTTGATTVTVTGTWNAAGTQVRFDVSGRLAPGASYALDLSTMTDAAGNALDGATYLGDGRLDWTTGPDLFVPFVAYSIPEEGSADATFRLTQITVAFSEAMDRSTDTVTISDGTTSFVAMGSWSTSGSLFRIDVINRLSAGRTYHIDFRGFRDAGGAALDATHPYLGDGILDFTTAEPTGENCRDALTVGEATLTGGVYEWVVPEMSVSDIDGSGTCDPTGTAADALIHYRKTTAAGSAGGSVLHIYAEDSTDDINIDVYRDICDPISGAARAAQVKCVWDENDWDIYLDAPAGDYYIWLSTESGTIFDGATVRVEELPMVPEGESCLNPYDTGSPATVYTAPATAMDPHVWVVPATINSFDMDVSWEGPGSMECDTDDTHGNVHGADAVISYNKSTDTSLLNVVVEPASATIGINVEVVRGCDPSLASATSLTCLHNRESDTTGGTDFTIGGPAGPLAFWLAVDEVFEEFPGATVRITEREPRPGSSCAEGIRVMPGATNPITPTVMDRFFPPSCASDTTNITWYRYTPTQNLSFIGANAPGVVAAIDAASGSELRCVASAVSPFGAFHTAGSDVCIAVQSGSAITNLSIEELAYTGVRGIQTDLNVTRPTGPTGTVISITLDAWMVATPTTVHMGINTTTTANRGVLSFPKAGGVTAEHRLLPAEQMGESAVNIGEAVFAVDDTLTAGTVRVYRLFDPSGMFMPVAWDTGSIYPATSVDALAYDGTNLLLAFDTSTTVTATQFFSLSPTMPGPATLIGTNATMNDVTAIAADATYVYLIGDSGATRGVWRLLRSSLMDPTAMPEPVVTGMGLTWSLSNGKLFVDNTTDATYLYFRSSNGDTHVVVDPDGTMPRYLGAISTLGTSSDFAMAYDPAEVAIFLFETTTLTTGNFVRLD